MKIRNRWLAILLAIFVLQFWACEKDDESHKIEHPATVEEVEGTELRLVTLTSKAMERIGVQTTTVQELIVSSSKPEKRMVVPYSSIIYDPQGQTWIYVSPQPQTFIRHKIDVDYIKGDIAVLNEGPPVGTVVATVGVAELYGTDFEIGH